MWGIAVKKFIKLFKNEEGQALIMVALLMVVILGFAALTVDIGTAYMSKSKLQSAADSAALAGAGEPIKENKINAAISVAKENDVESGVEGVSILVNSNIVKDTSEPTERDYTADEIAAIKVELENKSNQDLIDLAKANKVEDGLGTTTTPGSYTSDDFKLESDEKLIHLAKENALVGMLTLSAPRVDTAEVLAYKKLLQGLVSYTALAEVGISLDSNLNHDNWLEKSGAVKSNRKDGFIEEVLNAKYATYKVPSKDKDKVDLINAIVSKLNKNGVKVTTVNDKTALIQALIKKETDEKITEGKVKGNSSRVRVDITKDVPFSFARVLNINGTKVSVHAIAEKESWAGDALPFINLDGDAEKTIKGQPLAAWNMTGPGDKERISNNDLIISSNSIQVKYADGIEFKKGKVMSAIKEPLQKIAVKGNVVYIFSIQKDEIVNYQKGNTKELKNGDNIPLEDIVLLKCEVTKTWGGTGSEVIDLIFLEGFTWDKDKKMFISTSGESPDDMVKLVE